MRLAQRDYDALHRAILVLYSHRDAESFHNGVPVLLSRLIPADHFSLADCVVDTRARRVKLRETWDTGLSAEPARAPAQERHLFNHPFTQLVLRDGIVNAVRLSDLLPRKRLHATPLYRELLRPAGVEYVLSVGSFAGRGISMLTAARSPKRRDFSERDRRMMDLLRPHFDQARRLALALGASRTRRTRPLEAFGFTPREGEIAEWVSRGRSNPEIAIALRMRVRTVEKHLERILAKLGVENRTTAAVILANALAD